MLLVILLPPPSISAAYPLHFNGGRLELLERGESLGHVSRCTPPLAAREKKEKKNAAGEAEGVSLSVEQVGAALPSDAKHLTHFSRFLAPRSSRRCNVLLVLWPLHCADPVSQI